MTLAGNRSNGRFSQAGPRIEVVQDDSQARDEGNWKGPMTKVGAAKKPGLGRSCVIVATNMLQIFVKYRLSVYWVDSCPSKIHFHPEPQNMILFRNGIFANVISLVNMRSHWVKRGALIQQDRCPYEWRRDTDTETQERKPCEHRGRDRRSAATAKEGRAWPAATKGWEVAGRILP